MLIAYDKLPIARKRPPMTQLLFEVVINMVEKDGLNFDGSVKVFFIVD